MAAKQSVIAEITILKEKYNIIIPYFYKFADFINYLYRKLGSSSMIEVVSNGFLWVFDDSGELKKAVRIFRNLRRRANQQELKEFFREFTDIIHQDFNLEKDEPIEFKIEFINVDRQKIAPIIKDYFESLSEGITLQFSKQYGYYIWHSESLYDFSIFFGMVHFIAKHKELLEMD